MDRKEHLFTTAAEEACEVGQRISKALRFGLTEVQPGQPLTNAERIVEEFHQLYAMLDWLQVEGHIDPDLDLTPDEDTKRGKREKVEHFMAISREQGTLIDGVEIGHG
jgi:hypothetical protein